MKENPENTNVGMIVKEKDSTTLPSMWMELQI